MSEYNVEDDAARSEQLANNLEFIDIQMFDGRQREATREVIRREIELGVDPDGMCRVCEKPLQHPTGVGPHMMSHRRLIGDAPPRPIGVTKPKAKSKRTYTKKPSVDDACYGLLSALVGDKIPLSMIGDVQTWVEDTKKLIGSLK